MKRYRQANLTIAKAVIAGILILLLIVFHTTIYHAAVKLSLTLAAAELPADSSAETQETIATSNPSSQTSASPTVTSRTSSASALSVATTVSSQAAVTSVASTPSKASRTTSKPASSNATVTNTVKALEVQLTAGKDDIQASGIAVTNQTNETLNISSFLKKSLPMNLIKNAHPQILIIHTYGTETFVGSSDGMYNPTASTSSTDITKNVVALGDVMAKVLNDDGIKTIHDTHLYDSPHDLGAYDRAATAIHSWLVKYPSIEMVIDIHRDAVTDANGTKIKPTVVIGNKKAAQVMLVAGCGQPGSLPFSSWKSNLIIDMRLQKELSVLYPGLVRPIYFSNQRYNLNLTKNSLLIEVGSDVNTFNEALYSAQLTAAALCAVLNAG